MCVLHNFSLTGANLFVFRLVFALLYIFSCLLGVKLLVPVQSIAEDLEIEINTPSTEPAFFEREMLTSVSDYFTHLWLIMVEIFQKTVIN